MPYRFRNASRVREWLVPTSVASVVGGGVVLVLTIGPQAAMLTLPVLGALVLLTTASTWVHHLLRSRRHSEHRPVRVNSLRVGDIDAQTDATARANASPRSDAKARSTAAPRQTTRRAA